jgi:transcriptional regulator GlxA family with amidase domain
MIVKLDACGWLPLALCLVGAIASLVRAEERSSYTRNVAIGIWNGAEILDWTGPAEVFAAAGNLGQQGSEPAFHVYTVSKTKDAITSQGFIDVLPDYSIADAPKPDIVVFPGGGGASVLNDPEFFAWASRVASEAEVALSVCTGAFILAKAGLLDGKDATTWYGALDGFEQQYPNTRVLRGPRFVDNGQVVTTAGVSAGIDGSLHVVARLLGRHVADRTAEYMEYHWTPDAYLAKSYAVLNPSLDERGQQRQLAGVFVQGQNHEGAIRVCRELLAQDADDAATWRQLGDACYASRRYSDAADAYSKAARRPDYASRAWYNAACSAGLANDRERALECLKRAFEAGFPDANQARNDADLAIVRNDPRFELALAAGTRK